MVLERLTSSQRSDAPAGEEDWGEFSHLPAKRYYDFSEIRCEIEDINLNRSINDALANEEAFFRNHPVYHGLSHCRGVPKLAKKLDQILVRHIRSVLPGLNSCINSQLAAVAKEHAAYGDVVESKGFDLCEDVSDEDISMTIQNATGSKGALLVPEVPFEVLVRGQIGHLLDPSLRCAKFIYDELIKMSNRSLANELHQYPFLRKCMDEVIGNFLREGLQQAETMITHLIEAEMDYINISHPNFIGENKAVEIAQQQVKASRLAASVSRPKTLEELPLEADTVEMGYSLDSDSAGLPKIQSLSSSFNSASSDYNSPYTASPKIQGSRRRL